MTTMLTSHQNSFKPTLIFIVIITLAYLNTNVTAFHLQRTGISLPSTITFVPQHRVEYEPPVASKTPRFHSSSPIRTNTKNIPKENRIIRLTATYTTTQLSMGIMDFFKSRQNDFVKLESTESAYGPGPIILFFNVPDGISNEELKDMIEDGAPSASSGTNGGVRYRRYTSEDLLNGVGLMDGTVQQVLESALGEQPLPSSSGNASTGSIVPSKVANEYDDVGNRNTPILYFSGLSNTEMMQTYNIIAKEVFEESGEYAACAKAVEPAMSKSFRQLLSEIAGDHSEAIAATRS